MILVTYNNDAHPGARPSQVDAGRAAVLADLGSLRRAGKQHRPLGPRYMELRRLT
jgi:hypothetical protein